VLFLSPSQRMRSMPHGIPQRRGFGYSIVKDLSLGLLYHAPWFLSTHFLARVIVPVGANEFVKPIGSRRAEVVRKLIPRFARLSVERVRNHILRSAASFNLPPLPIGTGFLDGLESPTLRPAPNAIVLRPNPVVETNVVGIPRVRCVHPCPLHTVLVDRSNQGVHLRHIEVLESVVGHSEITLLVWNGRERNCVGGVLHGGIVPKGFVAVKEQSRRWAFHPATQSPCGL